MDEHSIAVPPESSTGLDVLACGINDEHRLCRETFESGVRHAHNAGLLLLEAKSQMLHGDWLRWLRENFEGSERTAQAYMRLARHWSQLAAEDPQRAADLSLRDALALLASPQSKTVEDDELLDRAAAALWRLDQRLHALEAAPATAETITPLEAVANEATKWHNHCMVVRLRTERHRAELSDELAALLRSMNIHLAVEFIFTHPDEFAAMCREVLAARVKERA